MEEIKGIWDSEYVQELGIFDHCKEVLILKEEIIRIKASKHFHSEIAEKASCSIRTTLEGELVDLYLILKKWTKNKKHLKLERINRFLEKEENEKNNI